MKKHQLITIWTLLMMLAGGRTLAAPPEAISLDDFDDGDDNGWTPVFEPGPDNDVNYNAEGFNYILESPSGDDLVTAWDLSADPFFSQGFLRAKVHAGTLGTGGHIVLRGDPVSLSGYGFAATTLNEFSFAIRRLGAVTEELAWVSPDDVPFRPEEDWYVEGGAINGQLSMKFWRVGDPEPLLPQLTAVDTQFTTGVIGLTAGTTIAGVATSLAFDDLEFTPGMPVDFNMDKSATAADTDLLVEQIMASSPEAHFDITGDGLVDVSDLDAWLLDAATCNGFAASYLPGDANLDGKIDATDLNELAVNWQQPVTAWSGGDFTADGIVDVNDLNLLAVNWQQSIPLAASEAAPVPEPKTGLLALLVGCAILGRAVSHDMCLRW